MDCSLSIWPHLLKGKMGTGKNIREASLSSAGMKEVSSPPELPLELIVTGRSTKRDRISTCFYAGQLDQSYE
jgi:hypothetical protein